MSKRSRYYCNVLQAGVEELAMKRMAERCIDFRKIARCKIEVRSCVWCKHCRGL